MVGSVGVVVAAGDGMGMVGAQGGAEESERLCVVMGGVVDLTTFLVQRGEVVEQCRDLGVGATEYRGLDGERAMERVRGRVELAAGLLDVGEVVQAYRDLIVVRAEAGGPGRDRALQQCLGVVEPALPGEYRGEDDLVEGDVGVGGLGYMAAEFDGAACRLFALDESALYVGEAGEVVLERRGQGQVRRVVGGKRVVGLGVMIGGLGLAAGVLAQHTACVPGGGDQHRIGGREFLRCG